MTDQPDQPARTAVYSELMWPKWNQTSESYGAGEEKTNALLDAHAAEARAAEQPAPVERRRTTWPSATELQQAADMRRAAGDPLLADWLDETANALSWLAPYRDNEPGYGMWETAMVVARKILGTAEEQPATADAHPAEHTWAAELHDPLADEWVPGTRYIARDRAVKNLEHARAIGPTWKDGTPTQRRLVRATTTYTVEPVTLTPAEDPRAGEQR